MKQACAITVWWRMAIMAVMVTAASAKSFAQVPDNKASSVTAPAPQAESPKSAHESHRFWDKENDWLFVGVGASRTLDYFSTLNFRRRGRQEVLLTNDLVDDHAAFAAVEAGATGLSIGVSYIFHHYGHHKLERWTSFVHIGLATTGAVRNYSLKTFHTTSSQAVSLDPSGH